MSLLRPGAFSGLGTLCLTCGLDVLLPLPPTPSFLPSLSFYQKKKKVLIYLTRMGTEGESDRKRELPIHWFPPQMPAWSELSQAEGGSQEPACKDSSLFWARISSSLSHGDVKTLQLLHCGERGNRAGAALLGQGLQIPLVAPWGAQVRTP